MHVASVGGGIAGLALALMLHERRIGGTIYESYADPNSARLMIVALNGAPAANVGSTLAAGTTSH